MSFSVLLSFLVFSREGGVVGSFSLFPQIDIMLRKPW